jgi:hypothetical protein
VQFDLLGNGDKLSTGWVGGKDGLLVLDRNGDGAINDGSELFGEGTTLANGQKAANGYQAMAELDTDGDGALTAADAAFSKLQVWVDANADGISDASELKSLAELNITKLNLSAQADGKVNNGNIVGLTSTYETADGQTHGAADVWFATNAAGSGNSSLAAALASYSNAPAAAGSTPKLDVTAATNLSATVANMAASLKAFDESSKLKTGNESLGGGEETLRLKALASATSHGFLASPSK